MEHALFLTYMIAAYAAFHLPIWAHATGRCVWTLRDVGRRMSDDELRRLDQD